MKTNAKAVVRIVVEVDLGQRWGDDCSVGQVHAQASREASEALAALLRDSRIMRQVRTESVAVSLEVV